MGTKKREFSVVKYYLSLVFRNLFSPDDLILHGDIGFGAEQQFENEARMALRLANFLSAFLQVNFIFVLNFRSRNALFTLKPSFLGSRFNRSFLW
jgi:hypothetical protein